MALLPKHDAVRALKTLIAAHQQAPAGNRALPGDGELYPFGIAAIDEVLQGGIAANAAHEVRCAHARDAGAATGFALGLLSGVLSLKARQVPAGRIVWVLGPAAAMETGLPCPDGLCEYGLDPCRIILARPGGFERCPLGRRGGRSLRRACRPGDPDPGQSLDAGPVCYPPVDAGRTRERGLHLHPAPER